VTEATASQVKLIPGSVDPGPGCTSCEFYDEDKDMGDYGVVYYCRPYCEKHAGYGNLRSFPFQKTMSCFQLTFWQSEFAKGLEEALDKGEPFDYEAGLIQAILKYRLHYGTADKHDGETDEQWFNRMLREWRAERMQNTLRFELNDYGEFEWPLTVKFSDDLAQVDVVGVFRLDGRQRSVIRQSAFPEDLDLLREALRSLQEKVGKTVFEIWRNADFEIVTEAPAEVG